MHDESQPLMSLALSLMLFVAGILFLQSDIALGQERDHGPETMDAKDTDRLARIEQKLHHLQVNNQQLQKRCHELNRKYESLLRQGNDPIFGSSAGNTDSMGIPGGLNLRPTAAFLQGKARQHTGEGGAGEDIDGNDGNAEPERERATDRVEQVEERPAIESPPPRERVQSGTGGGAGEVIEPATPAIMADYVNNRGAYQPNMRPLRLAGAFSFRQGLSVRTADDFFTWEFHNLTQADYRDFGVTGDALHDNFVIPRQRWYFQGQVSPYAYYYAVINRGYGSLNLLDSWADLNVAPKYKQQFQFRIGRMKTPYTYEYIKLSANDLIAPERSLFVMNFDSNRQIGAMVHGYVLDNSLEYYAGVFNGPRRSFQDFNNSKDLFGLFNWKPFLHSGIEWLEQLNLTGSINGGNDRDPTQPIALTTANDQSPTSSSAIVNVSPTFLIFKSTAFENGMRMQWAGDVAYYYKSFTMLANYAGAFQDYSLQGSGALPSATVYGPFASGAFVGVGNSKRTRVPIEGWSIAVSYFLTGEEITRRVYLTEPRRPFGYYNGRFNPGAIEAYFRFANLQLGDQVFTGGLATAADWANRVSTTDTGINWYWNHYVRLYFDWQHAFYNRPVFMSDNQFTRHNDLYWFRTQIFF